MSTAERKRALDARREAAGARYNEAKDALEVARNALSDAHIEAASFSAWAEASAANRKLALAVPAELLAGCKGGSPTEVENVIVREAWADQYKLVKHVRAGAYRHRPEVTVAGKLAAILAYHGRDWPDTVGAEKPASEER